MTPRELFYRRLIFEWKFQYRVLKMVIDWTVGLYLVIPALGLVVYQYVEWWKEPPAWIPLLNQPFILAVAFLFAWSGSLRIFIQDADQLFFLNHESWLYEIIQRGIFYSILVFLGSCVLFFLALSPLALLSHQWTITQLSLLFLMTFLTKLILGLTKQLLSLRYQGWRQYVLSKGLLIMSGLIFVRLVPLTFNNSLIYGITVLLLVVIAYLLIKKRIDFRINFLGDIQRELEERLKYVGFLMGLSGVKVKKPKKAGSRPWLFRKSERIFKKRNPSNALLELGIKLTLRNRRLNLQYIQMLALMLFIVSVTPGDLKWILWVVFAFIEVNFIGSFWMEIISLDSFPLIKWKEEDIVKARLWFLLIITLPSLWLMGFVISWQTASVINIPVVIPLSFILDWLICRFVLLIPQKSNSAV